MAIQRGGGSGDFEKYLLNLVRDTQFPSSRQGGRFIPSGQRMIPQGTRMIPARTTPPAASATPSLSDSLSELLGFDTSSVNFQNVGRVGQTEEDRRQVDDSLSALNTDQLNAQVGRQINTAEELTGERPEPDKPSTLERVFDVLMRGQYAMAEGMDKSLDLVREDVKDQGVGGLFNFSKLGERLGAFGRGAVEGVTGREKANFHELIQENTGKKNVGTGIGGFLLDVFADPTTYLTLGTGAAAKAGVRGAGKSIASRGVSNKIIEEAAEGAAVRAAKTVRSDPKTVKAAEEAVRNYQNKMLKEAASAGEAMKKIKKSDLDKIKDSFVREEMEGAATKARNEFLEQNQRSFQVRFAGKNLLPKGPGKKIYNKAYQATEPIRQTKTVRAFNSLLNPKADLGVLHEPYRRNKGMGATEFQNRVDKFRKMVAGMSKSDAEQIALQREAGTFLEGELGQVQNAFGEAMDEMFEVELKLGLHSTEEYLENYVPHYYRNTEEKINGFRTQRDRALNRNISAQEKRRIHSIEWARENGMDPITDVREIFLRRSADHHRKVSTVNFLNEVGEDYGIKLKGMKKKSRQALVKQFEEAGMPLEKVTFNNFKFSDEVYVPQHINNILKNLDKSIESSTAVKEILGKLDKFQGAIKTGFTVLVPGHHVRNAIGDMFLNLEDGVVNPARYKHAAQIVAGRSEDAAGTARRAALDSTKIKAGGATLSLWDVHKLYERVGLRSGFYDTEINRSLSKSGLRVVNRARNFSTGREDLARTAHFIDALKKEMPKDIKPGQRLIEIERAARRAGERVSKFNFDYGDLTNFEQNVMRRTFLFYTFLRKNLPLQIEMMALNPGKVALAPKINSAVEQILGGPQDIQMENAIPKWIKEMAAPVVGGTERNPIYSTIQLPTADLGRISSDPGELSNQLLTLLRPELKGIAELGTGTQSFSGAPIDSQFDYATSQLPFNHIIQKMLDPERETEQKKTDLVNMLTGLGLQEATEPRRRGELRRQQDIVQKIISEIRKEERGEIFRQPR